MLFSPLRLYSATSLAPTLATPFQLIHIFVELEFSSTDVTTDKKSSAILIYSNKDKGIYTENENVD
jgi:hypothetical protein